MRILHTADWHLGRIFHGRHLTQDQAHVLAQFIEAARDVRPHAILIAGDVYDRAVPPPEAVELLNDTLAQLAAETDARIILIAGNHDSPQRLGFGAPLLAGARVHLCTRFALSPAPVVVEDAHGPVRVYPLPYAEPALARSLGGDDSLREHADVLAAQLARARKDARNSGGARAVVVAHATVLGAEESESERPLAIGGAGAVPPALFDGFAYVALGHLHRPQWVRRPQDDDTSAPASRAPVRYAGSLLKYSFSEAGHVKSASLVELDAAGRCRLEEIPLTPRHDVRRVSGTLEELLRAAASDPAPDDYILAEVTDTGPLPDAPEKLAAVYPNLMRVERPWLARAAQQGLLDAQQLEKLRRTPLHMCAAFIREMTGEEPDEDTLKLLEEVIGELQRAGREAQSAREARPARQEEGA